MRTSSVGLDLIRSFEGFRETSVRLPDGRWTVGYGHVRTAREGIRISEQDALDLLVHDLGAIEDAFATLIYASINQNQFDALVSFAFNISLGQFRESKVLEAVNAGDEIGAASAFDGWRKARVNGRMIIVDALVRRRAAEKALFLEPVGRRPTAPTPIVTPILDTGMPAPVLARVDEPQPYQTESAEPDDTADHDPPAEIFAPDIARAVAELAGRLGPSEPRKSPLQGSAQEPEKPAAASASPSQVAAQRLSKILSRVEGPAAKPSAPLAPPASEPEIPLDLPDLSNPGARAGPHGRKVLIDDTEIIAPNGTPDAVFKAALERARQIEAQQNARKGAGKRRVWLLAPWFLIAVLCALGLGVAVVETSTGERPDDLLGGAAPTMIAVFGLLLAMSGYYILRQLSDED